MDTDKKHMTDLMLSTGAAARSRLYGLRNYRRQLDAALRQDTSHAAVAPDQD
jgi:hypothetical protein